MMSEDHDGRETDGVFRRFESLEVDNVYQKFESFDFEGNRVFVDGLVSLQRSNIDADTDKLLQMKIFFYNRFIEPIDLTGYKHWCSGSSAVDHTAEALGPTGSHLSPSQPHCAQRHMDIEQSLTACTVHLLSSESSTATRHSSEYSTDTQHSSEYSTATRHSSEYSTDTQHSSEYSTATQHSPESSTATQHSSEPSTATQHSSESSTATQHSSEPSTATQHSSEPSTATQHSPESSTATQHSSESSTANQHSLESSTATRHSLESSTATRHSLESSTASTGNQLSFAEVMRLVQAGQDVPGVSHVDVQPSNLNQTPSQLTRRLKPWET